MVNKEEKRLKIALVAMSGVRACDGELLELGLTLPGFLERSKTIASLPSLGLLTLAGMTPNWCDIEYIEVDQIDECGVSGEEWGAFDLVAISTFSAQVKEAYELCGRLKGWGVGCIAMGGFHVTSLPNEALEHCDVVLLGRVSLYGWSCWGM